MNILNLKLAIQNRFIPYRLGAYMVIAILLSPCGCNSKKSNPVLPKVSSVTPKSTPSPLISWPLPEPFKISTTDLEFGKKQVEQMVQDRPKMAQYVNRQSPIWNWCVCQFAGVTLGQRIYWNNDEPEPDSNGADDQYPDEKGHAFIRIGSMQHSDITGKDYKLPCEDLWNLATFELNNLSNSTQFKQCYEDAIAGKLTKRAWVERNTRLEYLTNIETHLVYKQLWDKTLQKSGSFWELRVWDTYEKWISAYKDPSKYPWDSWGKYYDDQIIPYLKKKTGIDEE